MKHIVLAQYRVLYIGSVLVPNETEVGLEAFQQPLKEVYAVDSDRDVSAIDAWCTVLSSGLQVQYVMDTDTVWWFPIQTLHLCAAVKCDDVINLTTEDNRFTFVDLDLPGESIIHPPLFAAIMRRTGEINLEHAECHLFIAQSNQDAKALARLCILAYAHQEDWADITLPQTFCSDEHDEIYMSEENNNKLGQEDPVAPWIYNSGYMSMVAQINLLPKLRAPPPSKDVYFYGDDKDLVKSYNIISSILGQKNKRGLQCRDPIMICTQLLQPPPSATECVERYNNSIEAMIIFNKKLKALQRAIIEETNRPECNYRRDSGSDFDHAMDAADCVCCLLALFLPL